MSTALLLIFCVTPAFCPVYSTYLHAIICPYLENCKSERNPFVERRLFYELRKKRCGHDTGGTGRMDE